MSDDVEGENEDEDGEDQSPGKIAPVSRTRDSSFMFWPYYARTGSSDALGASAFYFYRYAGEPYDSRPSNIRLTAAGGSNKYVKGEMIFDNYWSRELHNIVLKLVTERYNSADINFYVLYRQRVNKSDYLGVKYDFYYLQGYDAIGSERASGLGVLFGSIHPENIFMPPPGLRYELSNMFYFGKLGSSSDFGLHSLDVRYFSVLGRSTLWFTRFFTELSSGEPIDTYMPSLHKSLRGYWPYTYQGRHTATIETELRYYFWSDFAGTMFAGLGQTAQELELFRLNNNKFSYGFGMRYFFYKKLGINVFADYVKLENANVWLVGVGERI